MGKIFFYSRNQIKCMQLQIICGELSLGFCEIPSVALDKPVSALLGGPIMGNVLRKPMPPLYLQPELLIFSGLTEAELDQFLAVYRNSGLEEIPCKAVVTPYNLSLTLWELTQELMKEHRKMHGES